MIGFEDCGADTFAAAIGTPGNGKRPGAVVERAGRKKDTDG